MKSTFLPIFICILLSGQSGFAQTGFYNIDSIQEIKLEFFQSNWDAKLDSLKSVNEELYLLAKSVEINGVLFDSVGVKYKGNSSYKASNKKNPMHISLDYVHGGADYKGFNDVKLGNGFSDPSMIREPLSYELLRQYMDAPRANFAKLWINGTYWGVYCNQESIDKKFTSKHFDSNPDNPMFKCNPVSIGGPSGSTLPTLVYSGTDSTANAYKNAYELKSDWGWKPLIALMDTLKNHPNSVEKVLDVDRALWMIAFNDLFINLDSYTGSFSQNYYLYLDDNNRWLPIVWDLNMSFGTFNMVGSGGGGGGSLSIAQMQSMDPLIQSTNANRPLIQKLLANPVYKRMYLAHLRTMMNENFSDLGYADRAVEMQNIIDADVNADPNKFFTYQNFHDNINQTIVSGGGGAGPSAPGITTLMEARYDFLSANANLTPTHPTISDIAAVPASPIPNQPVWISAHITDANSVYLGYRAASKEIFTKVTMYDDGQHNDGAAGDNVYGASFPADIVKNQYYIYAENANAGAFSPERAEYEFYTIRVDLPAPPVGSVVINEFLADNQTGETDEADQTEDWVEFYNRDDVPYDLEDLFLTDKASVPLKWAFPKNSVILPHGYLTVWLDEDGGQGDLHASFKLSASGEFLMLSDSLGAVYDSLSFGPQLPDISYGRYPNGTGSFTYMPTTYNRENSLTSGTSQVQATKFVLFPNPADNTLNIRSEEPLARVHLYDLLGRPVMDFDGSGQTEIALPLETVGDGFYVVKIGNATSRVLVLHR